MKSNFDYVIYTHTYCKQWPLKQIYYIENTFETYSSICFLCCHKQCFHHFQLFWLLSFFCQWFHSWDANETWMTTFLNSKRKLFGLRLTRIVHYLGSIEPVAASYLLSMSLITIGDFQSYKIGSPLNGWTCHCFVFTKERSHRFISSDEQFQCSYSQWRIWYLVTHKLPFNEPTNQHNPHPQSNY